MKDTEQIMPEKKAFERLPVDVVPSNYNICLKPNLKAFTFDGNETISLEVSRVKPGIIGRQGSSDRPFYISFTALPTDTCSERSYPFVFATNLLSIEVIPRGKYLDPPGFEPRTPA